MLFIVFLQFADSHPYIEELWGTLCQFWPNNLKVILRYLLIISGMAPNELLANVSISCAGLNTSFHLIYAGNIRKCDSLQRLIKASDFVLRYRRATRNWFALFGLFFFFIIFPQAKRVALYLARSCTNRLLDELMSELQTVETLNCLIERTETPPFYRLTSMRKASSHSDGKSMVQPVLN